MDERHSKEGALREIVRIMTRLHGDYNLVAQDVAEEMGVGVTWLRRLLDEEMGITFRGLLNEIRVEKAKGLTREGKVKGWKECALKAGFNDPRYFSRVFKRQEGCTWTEWKDDEERRALRDDNLSDAKKDQKVDGEVSSGVESRDLLQA